MQLEFFRILVRRHVRELGGAVGNTNPVECFSGYRQANRDDWSRREQQDGKLLVTPPGGNRDSRGCAAQAINFLGSSLPGGRLRGG